MNNTYKVEMDYYAIDLQRVEFGGSKAKKFFKKGSIVFGRPYLGKKKGVQSDYILVAKRYLLPTDYLNEVGNVSQRVSPINSNSENMDIIEQRAKEIHQENTFGADGEIKDVGSIKYRKSKDKIAQGWKYGASLGGVIGVTVCLIYRKPVWIGALVGGIGGGYVGQEIAKNATRTTINGEYNVDL